MEAVIQQNATQKGEMRPRVFIISACGTLLVFCKETVADARKLVKKAFRRGESVKVKNGWEVFQLTNQKYPYVWNNDGKRVLADVEVCVKKGADCKKRVIKQKWVSFLDED